MATEKLPEVPNDLPPAASSVRDEVNDTFERFMGPAGLLRNEQGVPIERNLLDNEYNIVGALKRIRNIPQWERGVGFKPGLKAEWDSFFALLPKWYSNIRSRLDEKNKFIGADEDASAESREIGWMMGRLSKLQTDIDFAAQEALAPPPDPKFAPVQTDDVKKAVEALDQQVQATRAKLTEIASRGGATEPGPRLKGVFSAFKAYVGIWNEAKPGYTAPAQVPTDAAKKTHDGFVRDAETAWANDNPGKVAPPSAAPSGASSAPPKASEAKAASPGDGLSTTTIWAAAGVLGLGALYLASRKR
jgi:hypothetical protein